MIWQARVPPEARRVCQADQDQEPNYAGVQRHSGHLYAAKRGEAEIVQPAGMEDLDARDAAPASRQAWREKAKPEGGRERGCQYAQPGQACRAHIGCRVRQRSPGEAKAWAPSQETGAREERSRQRGDGDRKTQWPQQGSANARLSDDSTCQAWKEARPTSEGRTGQVGDVPPAEQHC